MGNIPNAMSIEGEWVGYYLHPEEDERCPILARFEIEGNRLSGTMVDERTSWTYSVREWADNPETDPQLRRAYEDFLEQYPDVTHTTTLSPNSLLKGFIRGNKIRFTKHYSHPGWSIWAATNLETIHQVSPPTHLEYIGTLNLEETVINGEWKLSETGLYGLIKSPQSTGTFRLKRRVQELD